MWPSKSTHGYIFKENKVPISQRDICSLMFIAVLSTIAKNIETTWVSMDGWMCKENVGNISIMEYHVVWKGENPGICNNMGGLWKWETGKD